MRREDKIQFVLEDDRNRITKKRMELEEREQKLNELQTLLNSPGLPEESIEDDYQTATLEVTEVKQRVYDYRIPNNRAAVIEYIGNDWYSGLTYEFIVDNHVIFEDIERQIAPTNDTKQVNILAKDRILWLANNTNTDVDAEERDIAVVAGGKLVPERVYEIYNDLYNSYDDDYSELIEIPSEVREPP